ncbi:MAG: hypothetical protein R3214_00935 [Christiangramia sp.]|nr:hypothetical protein [Christiangramia sp.]
MANILDIFRTHTGERLITRAGELTLLDKQEIERAFIFTLPALLSIFRKTEGLSLEQAQDLISFIEKADLTSEGEKILNQHLNKDQFQNLKSCADMLEIDKEAFQNILNISAAFLAATITQMNKIEKDVKVSDLIPTLSGQDVKYDEAFISTIVKHDESPGIIDSSEKIALGHKKDDNDQSILGGYSGGR